MSAVLRCGRYRLDLSRPLIMGVVNFTPDSFSDGGQFASPAQAASHAQALIAEGAHLIDIGGESTRPGAAPVTLDEERRRVLPLLERLTSCGVPVSVDTRRPELMREVIAGGASMINDINALAAPGALEAVAASDAAVCLMHMQGDPLTMQADPRYNDVVPEVEQFLRARIAAANHAGIASNRIVADPGFGFGKTYEHNLALLRAFERFRGLGTALLAGLSRKSMLGRITGREVGERIFASVAAAIVAVDKGAHILRVHDVAATRDALAVWSAVNNPA